jgi:lysophospholipase L1-like esterase
VSVDSDGWTINPANQSTVRDGFFGLGGVSFRGSEGAYSRFWFRERSAQQLDLDYLPGGGTVAILAGGQKVGSINTSQGEGHAVVNVPAVRSIEIRVESGDVRLFGVFFAKTQPGISYSSLGLNGAYISLLVKMFNGAHWQRELRHAKPDLVVINYGTNESVYAEFVDKEFEKELRATITRVQAALPEASILVMSPMDRGKRDSSGAINTVPALHRVVTIQQRVAADLGVGFFDTFDAMGGPGTMGRWYQAEPRLVSADFIHPMPQGAKIVGTLLYKALTNGYQSFKTQEMQGQYEAEKP